MKKIAITTLALALTFVMAGSAMAWGGPGNGMRGGYGCPYSANLTPEQLQKAQAFQQEIQPLQQKRFQIRNEIRTLRTQQNPDWNAISAKQREMFELRMQIQQKAIAKGVAGQGYGYGYGRHGRGMGRW